VPLVFSRSGSPPGSRAFFFRKSIGLSAPQLDPVGPTHHGAESGGVVVRVHLARADGY